MERIESKRNMNRVGIQLSSAIAHVIQDFNKRKDAVEID